MENVVIVAAVRSAIGAFGGVISEASATTLGSAIIRGLLERSGLKAGEIDEVILGNVLTAGCGQNPARQSSYEAGLPYQSRAYTINKVCGSGLKAIQLGVQAISCQDADIVIAGGQENMDMAAHILNKSRKGQRMGNWELVDSLIQDGLCDAFGNYHMGITAENIAEKFRISRTEQDEFAVHSQAKANEAIQNERFAREIIPIQIEKRGTVHFFDKDEFPRPGTNLEVLSRLKPAFKENGTVTAGNSSGINNGAAAVLLMSETKAHELGLKPLARIAGYANVGVDPSLMGTGPIMASKKALSRAGWDVQELDLIESNEAFAAQAIAVNREMQWDTEKVNVNGGAIALGHPIGASGARIVVTLLHEMLRRDARKGLATLCIGGGMGAAMLLER
ncbi:acetyl-CoA C-acetyltransferase [Paenibacillus sp. HN-1]|uniref:acetyl-CoA C-acetyltransferase n=1 Tax=Paenibacillus TaxID=44249 RepID=UPI001CA8AC18|nr:MULTISPECIES: acetyl-CoA C-acetyltransferase [Paenibacillus]MBY9078044.1 acetyl-CoA C-acetyltransferase [Paenibacillus sp. CGMCC 1.18879]MBY9083785.1 acetyl-CoA C-acetyltransferase [Paenibacillus sinensis]